MQLLYNIILILIGKNINSYILARPINAHKPEVNFGPDMRASSETINIKCLTS